MKLYVPILCLGWLLAGKALIANDRIEGLLLNEFMASNGITIEDEDGDSPAWLELYNSSTDTIFFEKVFVSDDPEDLKRWSMPDTFLAPNAHLLVFTSGKNRRDIGAALHTNFSISSSGEPLFLMQQRGDRLDTLDKVDPVVLTTDASYGRKTDGAEEWGYFDAATPGTSNNAVDAFATLLSPIRFSHANGFYAEDTLFLKAEAIESGVEIRYTTDGSEPTAASPLFPDSLMLLDRTQEPNVLTDIRTSHIGSTRSWIPPSRRVHKGHLIRAKAFKGNALAPKTSTGHFFIGAPKTDVTSFPVFSIGTHADAFFDHDSGIYVPGAAYDGNFRDGNFNGRGHKWERPIHLAFFDADGQPGFAHDAGVRIHGNFTRTFPQKSLRLYARNAYAAGRFKYPFFQQNGNPLDDFNRLILRNSGNDWNMTMFRDLCMQSLVRDLNFDFQSYLPTVVYLNGEYWGIHNLRERYDRFYFETNYNIPEDSLDLLRATIHEEGNLNIVEGTDEHYRDMIDFMQNNDLNDANAWKEVEQLIDIEGVLDYYATQIYNANTDWPHNNCDFWRYRTASGGYDSTAPAHRDGRWRFLLVDVDRSLGYVTHNHHTLLWATRLLNPRTEEEWPNVLFRALLENEQFEERFINRLLDHLNTTFHPDRVNQQIQDWRTHYQAEISTHIQRWSRPNSWNAQVNIMSQFAGLRPRVLRQHLWQHFQRDSLVEVAVDLDPKQGRIKVNDFVIDTSVAGIPREMYPWKGTYIKDVAIRIEAIAAPGYQFAYWEETGDTQSTLHLKPQKFEETPQLTAVFEEQPTVLPPVFDLSKHDFHFLQWNKDLTALEQSPYLYFYQTSTLPYFQNFKNDIWFSGKLEKGWVGMRANGVAWKESEEASPTALRMVLKTENSSNIRVRWRYRNHNSQSDSDLWTLTAALPQDSAVELAFDIETLGTDFVAKLDLPDAFTAQDTVILTWQPKINGQSEAEVDGQLVTIGVEADRQKPLSEKKSLFCEQDWQPLQQLGEHAQTLAPYMGLSTYLDQDPSLQAPATGFWSLPLDLFYRSRVNAKEGQLAFLNTSNAQNILDSAYVGDYQIRIETLGLQKVKLSWDAFVANESQRMASIRPAYRFSENEDFRPFFDEYGEVIVFHSDEDPTSFEMELPQDLMNQENVYLQWRYFHPSDEAASGVRPQIVFGNLQIEAMVVDLVKEEDAYHLDLPNHSKINTVWQVAGETVGENLRSWPLGQGSPEVTITHSACEESPQVVPRNIDQDGLSYRLFPNPTIDGVFIESGQNLHYQLYDIKGKLLQYGHFKEAAPYLDLSQLASGVYTLYLQDEAGNRSTEKLIKH